MLENFEDRKTKNHITSSNSQFLWRTSPLVETNPLQKDNYAKLTKARYFLICRSCLWCASCIKNETTFTKCPICYNGEIHCTPIGENGNCFFDYSHSKGVELKFANNIRC